MQEKNCRLAPLNATPTVTPTQLANVVMETTPPVITLDVSRLASPVLVIVFNRFIFFARLSLTSISSSKYVYILIIFSRNMLVISDALVES